MTKSRKNDFIMDTDWLFQGIIDAEQKQYILLDYFQKLNKDFEEMKIYPMFIELSLHLGNIQTLLTQNKILYTEKKFKTPDDELLLSDLKLKEIPVLTNEEEDEFQKILKNFQPQFHDYFNFAKSLWTVVYDSIDLKIVKNVENIDRKTGFFYLKHNDITYVWKYTSKKVYKADNQFRTELKLLYKQEDFDLSINEIIKTQSNTYDKYDESNSPVFEVTCDNIFPLKETLIPIVKRKIMAYISQVKKEIKLINGVS